ncbi:MAG: hypothetical protein ACJAR2_003280 [Ilumatobacter sp.]
MQALAVAASPARVACGAGEDAVDESATTVEESAESEAEAAPEEVAEPEPEAVNKPEVEAETEAEVEPAESNSADCLVGAWRIAEA